MVPPLEVKLRAALIHVGRLADEDATATFQSETDLELRQRVDRQVLADAEDVLVSDGPQSRSPVDRADVEGSLSGLRVRRVADDDLETVGLRCGTGRLVVATDVDRDIVVRTGLGLAAVGELAGDGADGRACAGRGGLGSATSHGADRGQTESDRPGRRERGNATAEWAPGVFLPWGATCRGNLGALRGLTGSARNSWGHGAFLPLEALRRPSAHANPFVRKPIRPHPAPRPEK